MKVIYAPKKDSGAYHQRPRIFLAGTIDNGAGEEWQKWVEEQLKDYKVVLLNPRRPDWNPDLKPTADCPEFVEQVNWELDGIAYSNIILFYFAGGSISPVTMLELGMCLGQENAMDSYSWSRTLIYCDKNFWRRGNIEITCKRAKTHVWTDKQEWIDTLKRTLDTLYPGSK